MTLRLIRSTAQGCIFATCFAICVNDCFFEVHGVTGNSMSPTLSPNYHATGAKDLVLFSKFFPARNLSRGNIVSFWKPHAPEELSVKRIVGLPGDIVYPDDRHPVSEIKVPFGEVWVEGDNREKTMDSNDFGTISQNLIIGKAKYILWPFNRTGTRPWESFHSDRKVVPGSVTLPEEYMD